MKIQQLAKFCGRSRTNFRVLIDGDQNYELSLKHESFNSEIKEVNPINFNVGSYKIVLCLVQVLVINEQKPSVQLTDMLVLCTVQIKPLERHVIDCEN